ncbi:MAG: AraC family transcriptional regulator [Bacteroidota bacterium]
MEKVFPNKIRKIIQVHLEEENFSVDDLTSEIGLSKTQLWRKIKAETGKSANQFIREVRLKEAAKLIIESEYTASEVSYRAGFSSLSYFSKCFHDYFGYIPEEF